ncbi:Mitochondrial carrier protein MTM1 [Sesamum angolense]|uniref:Mitochondrial carrier protein MTM1 n=1 Tax=Sesamum angolense TaxID=2727404 RepID=A0AAE1XHD5_9LAMI|nr:Mitochondrial carrier protein MTM1 [Sesamum angolense]
MVGSSRQGLSSWMGVATATRKVELDKNMVKDESWKKESSKSQISHVDLSFGERAFSAGAAAFISAVIVNPLDVAKTRLQAQAAGVPYDGSQVGCSETSTMLQDWKYMPSSVRGSIATPTRSPDTCYRGTLDVFYKVTVDFQEGFSRLWRGTVASLALAIPSVGIYMPLYDIFRNYLEDLTTQNTPSITPYIPLVAGSLARSIACFTCYPIDLARTRMQAFKHSQGGVKPPGLWKTLTGVLSPLESANNNQAFRSYRILWTGLGAQLARDVPFSAVCWASLEPLRRRILSRMGDEGSATSIVGANFCAGFVAGSVAAVATCPVDVARTRRQIEKDPMRALTMTTRQTLTEIWRDGGIKGLFAGGGPRVARAGPSVGIVVSVYEVVKMKNGCEEDWRVVVLVIPSKIVSPHGEENNRFEKHTTCSVGDQDTVEVTAGVIRHMMVRRVMRLGRHCQNQMLI